MNGQFEALGEQERTKAFCLVAVVAVLIATLWPLNPFPRNGVTWLQGTSGLRFEKAGLVVSNAPLRLPETETGTYSLELLLWPASTRSVRTILALYVPTRPKQFMVRQWADGLRVTHDATVDNDKTRTIKFDVDHVFHPGRLVLVTISSGSNGTTVYLDGQPVQSFAGFKISRGELSGDIVLGTSPTTYQPWAGGLRGVAIYSKALTPADAFRHFKQWTDPSGGHPDLDGAISRYAFLEASGREVHNEVASGPNLEIPVTFSVPHKVLLQSVAKEFRADRRYAIDLLENIAGFIPLGLIVCAYFGWTRRGWKAILITIIACGILSFVIEVSQYYIPRRGSGMTDIITNTVGAAIGAVLTQVSPFRHLLLRAKLIRAVQRSATE